MDFEREQQFLSAYGRTHALFRFVISRSLIANEPSRRAHESMGLCPKGNDVGNMKIVPL